MCDQLGQVSGLLHPPLHLLRLHPALLSIPPVTKVPSTTRINVTKEYKSMQAYTCTGLQSVFCYAVLMAKAHWPESPVPRSLMDCQSSRISANSLRTWHSK